MRILVIQTAFVGDVVLTTPFLKALGERFAGAEIHVVATPQGCEILKGLPGISLHVLDKRTHGRVKGINNVLDSLGRKNPFDILFSVHRSLRSLALGRKVKAKRRIAFRSFWSVVFRYETVRYPPYDDAIHYADKPMALLAQWQGGPRAARPTLEVDRVDLAAITAKLGSLSGPSGYLVMSPFSVWGTKIWFADRFARAGAAVSKKHGIPVVLIGTGSDRERVIAQTTADKIVAAGGRALSLVGQTSLGELKALIRGARLVLTNDSAPVHVAAAFNVPTVAIFGPTVRKWGFFPLAEKTVVVERFDVSCRPCSLHGPRKCPRGHFRCMDLIQVDDVVAAVEKLL